MNRLEFAAQFIHLRGRPIAFEGRPYLHAPYLSPARRVVIRASRQVEKSTFLVNAILHQVVTWPGSHVLFVCPRQEQAQVFSNSRLVPALAESPVLRRALLGQRGRRPKVMNMRFRNGSEVFIRAAYHSADAARGIDADLLLVDEFQDIADGDLPVLEETLSHSPQRRVILTGTPKTVDNHLERVFGLSTACEYEVPCACGRGTRLDERCLGPRGPVCPACGAALDARRGRWVPRLPDSTWGEGYWINHLMVPWVDYAELLERQRTYDPARFKNECLGLSTALGDHIVTRAELEACCLKAAMARQYTDVSAPARDQLVAGIDWGGGGRSRTVVAIGVLDAQGQFVVVHLLRLAPSEEPDVVLGQVADCCLRFRVRSLAADGGGNGHVYNRLLVDRLLARRPAAPPCLYAIHYSASGQEPYLEGVLRRWTIGRSASIGVVFGRIKKRTLLFPRLAESGPFLDDFACEVAEYDDLSRTIRYTHPESQPDDALHATNYALHLALLARSAGG